MRRRRDAHVGEGERVERVRREEADEGLLEGVARVHARVVFGVEVRVRRARRDVVDEVEGGVVQAGGVDGGDGRVWREVFLLREEGVEVVAGAGEVGRGVGEGGGEVGDLDVEELGACFLECCQSRVDDFVDDGALWI